MYKKQNQVQISFDDFNQPFGMRLNPNNRWVQKASLIPWKALEERYSELFNLKLGTIGKPFRMMFGAQLIKQGYSLSDEETVELIRENPYMQFFIGLSGYQDEKPFAASSLSNFRKRLTSGLLKELEEMKIFPYEDKEDD